MNIRDFAPEFTVFILSQDADLGSKVKYTLNELKYETYFFSDPEEMQRRVDLAPPHVIVIDQAALVVSLSEIFQKVLKVSGEVKFISLAQPDVLPQLSEFKNYNLVQMLDRTQSVCPEQVGLAVDQTCETLYRLYQNEQVYNLFRSNSAELEELKQKVENQKKVLSRALFKAALQSIVRLSRKKICCRNFSARLRSNPGLF